MIQTNLKNFKMAQQKMTFNLAKVKMGNSRNGFSMSAVFIINTIPVADFIDKGDGSEPDFFVYDNPKAKDLFNLFSNGIEDLPQVYVQRYDMTFKIGKALFVDLLHDALVSKKEFKLLA